MFRNSESEFRIDDPLKPLEISQCDSRSEIRFHNSKPACYSCYSRFSRIFSLWLLLEAGESRRIGFDKSLPLQVARLVYDANDSLAIEAHFHFMQPARNGAHTELEANLKATDDKKMMKTKEKKHQYIIQKIQQNRRRIFRF